MPVHNFRCSEHGLFESFQASEKLRDEEECPLCGKLSRKTFEAFVDGNGGIRVFRPLLHEHLGPEPILITSKRQLKEECDKRGAYCLGLEGGYNRRF
ncbi:MAG: hypothetical protein DDT18_00726 [Actinobacteria bacterium]|nr:hypothetical protein [Actinomycetota bacterium]